MNRHVNRLATVLITLLMLCFSLIDVATVQAEPVASPLSVWATPTPAATLAASGGQLRSTALPASQSGLGIPVDAGNWQVALVGVRTATSLEMGEAFNKTTATPKPGYAFLIIDMTIRSLDPTHAAQLSFDNVAIVDAQKTIHKADGGGWGENSLCAGCVVSLSQEVGASEMSVFAIVRSDGQFSMHFSSLTNEQPLSFVFVLDAGQLKQKWQLQFLDTVLLSFQLGDKAVYPVKTETSAQVVPLPRECQVANLRAAQSKVGLVYQAWVDNQLATRLTWPDGKSSVALCKGFAYETLQVAPDGAMLLQAAPLQGWASLYMIEPNGKVMSLVRNALAVRGDFVPGTNYALVTLTQLGAEGEELYLYSRKQGTMALLYTGHHLNYRIFPDGNLLVEGMTLETSARFEHMGQIGSGKLPALKLPEGRYSTNITADGRHLLYTEYEGGTSRLIFSNLDGSAQEEILRGDIPYGDQILAPDGNYLLMQTKGKGENMQQSVLYDLATGATQAITPDSNNLVYSFSPDGNWVVAISTLNRPQSDQSKTKKQTLYLFRMDDQQVVKEIEGEIVNYFFAPDQTSLAYTLKNEDETLTMFVVKLADLSQQPLGQGLLTGWTR